MFICLFVNHQHKHPFCGYNSRNRVQSATIHVFHKDRINRFMGSDRNEKDVSKPISFKRCTAPKPLDRFERLLYQTVHKRHEKKNVTIKYLLIIVMYYSNRLMVVILLTLHFIKESLTDFSSKTLFIKVCRKSQPLSCLKTYYYKYKFKRVVFLGSMYLKMVL